MDPVTMATMATVASAVGGTVSAVGSYQASKAQAEADQQRAAIEGKWAERRSLEERAGAQQSAANEHRKAQILQSRLGAVAGASGSGASDPTVMNLFEGIGREGQYNADAATASGAQKAAGISYQSALDRWTADSNASIRKSAATTTLIGNLANTAGSAAGSYAKTRMGAKYGGGYAGGTGYGG